MGKFYIGVTGYSARKFDEGLALECIIEAFDQIKAENPGATFVVVSGLTNIGIPKLAYLEATRRGWLTMGIACEKASEYTTFPCDTVRIVGKNWGDESQAFISQCLDGAIVRIGGGVQAHEEIKFAKLEGVQVLEYDVTEYK